MDQRENNTTCFSKLTFNIWFLYCYTYSKSIKILLKAINKLSLAINQHLGYQVQDQAQSSYHHV